MAASLNRVFLLGNVTRDPEVRYIPSGTAVCDIGLAINDRRKDANGQWVEDTTFVDVTLWGKTAEVAGQYVRKGSPLLIEGRLKLDSWLTNEGQKRTKLKIVGERMQLIGPKQAPTEDAYSAPAPAAPSQWEVDAAKDLARDAANVQGDDSDIPF